MRPLRARFVERFILPLVAGGEAHVGAPLGDTALSQILAEEADATLEDRLHDARLAVAAELQVQPIPMPLDEEALRIAVALHDLLFFSHPDAPAGSRGERARSRIADGAVAMLQLAATTDADRLVARHTVLHNLPTLARTDVRVSFWVGKREFHGQMPPPRLTAWPRVRRVHEEKWSVNCLAESAAPGSAASRIVRALLDASPLTDLWNPLRLDPPLDFSRLAGVLVEPEVCRMVAYRYLDLGLDKTGGALAQATAQLLGARDSGASQLQRTLAFVCHLHLCLLAASSASETPESIALRIVGRGDGTQRDFVGLFAAVHRAQPALAAPPDVRADRIAAARVAAYAAACGATCGSARTRELTGLVARGLGLADLAA